MGPGAMAALTGKDPEKEPLAVRNSKTGELLLRKQGVN